MRKIYKNKNYIKRDYEATNIIACIAEAAPNENWVLADESLITRLQPLYKENGVEYYGFM